MSREARFMCGLALILVPTIVYGGLAVLGVLSGGAYGMPAPRVCLHGVDGSALRRGGFFGLAHVRGLRILLYVGAALVIATTLPLAWACFELGNTTPVDGCPMPIPLDRIGSRYRPPKHSDSRARDIARI